MGAPRTTRPGPVERILEEQGDVLYDFALSVTGDAELALAAVRKAVPAALATYGSGLERSVLLGAVFAAAARHAVPPALLDADLIEPGPGAPEELQRLARTATLLLEPVQRGCLDLALRQGLGGEALSQALGVAPGLASVSVQTATDRAEQVIGAVLLARVGRHDCTGLADVCLEAVGSTAEKLAAAVVEHEDGCPACGDRRRALVPATTLLASVPAVPAPAKLKSVDLRRRTGIVRALRPPGWMAGRSKMTRPDRRWRPAVRAAIAAVVVLVVAVAVLWPRRGGEIDRIAAPGGQLVVKTTPIDFGASAVQGEIRVNNTGREPLVFETRAGVRWVSFVGGDGTLDPGTSAVVSAVLDRSMAPEGAADTEIRVQSNGGSEVVPVRAVVERAPELSGIEVTPPMVTISRCSGSTPAQVRVAVVEESGLAGVQLHWVRRGKPEQVIPMSAASKSSYLGAMGLFERPGEVLWWVSAVDIRGNRAVSPRQVLRVAGC